MQDNDLLCLTDNPHMWDYQFLHFISSKTLSYLTKQWWPAINQYFETLSQSYLTLYMISYVLHNLRWENNFTTLMTLSHVRQSCLSLSHVRQLFLTFSYLRQSFLNLSFWDNHFQIYRIWDYNFLRFISCKTSISSFISCETIFSNFISFGSMIYDLGNHL